MLGIGGKEYGTEEKRWEEDCKERTEKCGCVCVRSEDKSGSVKEFLYEFLMD